jgi:hypothetical protein
LGFFHRARCRFQRVISLFSLCYFLFEKLSSLSNSRLTARGSGRLRSEGIAISKNLKKEKMVAGPQTHRQQSRLRMVAGPQRRRQRSRVRMVAGPQRRRQRSRVRMVAGPQRRRQQSRLRPRIGKDSRKAQQMENLINVRPRAAIGDLVFDLE